MNILAGNKQKLIALAISLLISLALYGNGLRGDFVADDRLVILQNPAVGGGLSDFSLAFTNPYYYGQAQTGLYRPLTVASYNANKFINSSPFGFHLANIIINGLNAFIVFLIVSKLAGRKLAYLSLVLFSFIPIHSEAVSSIVGRAELLSFFFSALALLSVLRGKLHISSLFLFLGLLSKETAAGFFLAFIYLWKFYENKSWKSTAGNALYFIPPIVIYGILRIYVLGKYFLGVDHLLAYNPLRYEPFLPTLWTSLKVFWLYLLKTLIPFKLSSDYSFNQIPVIRTPVNYEVLLGLVILVLVIYLLIFKRTGIYGLSLSIFFFTFIPVSNWFVKIGTIMGERLMYAPSLGLVIAGSLYIGRFLSSKDKKVLTRLSYAVIAVVLSAYGFVIISRNRDWRNEETLARSAYAASPNSVVALSNMAYMEFNKKNYPAAKEWIEKALAVLPDHLSALYLAGHIYKNLGDYQAAQESWLKTIKQNPNYSKAYLSLGILYYELDQPERAESVLSRAFDLERRWNEAFPLALVKINLGKYDEALRVIEGLGKDSERRELNFARGLAYLKKGDRKSAGLYLSKVKTSNISMEEYMAQIIKIRVYKINEY